MEGGNVTLATETTTMVTNMTVSPGMMEKSIIEAALKKSLRLGNRIKHMASKNLYGWLRHKD